MNQWQFDLIKNAWYTGIFYFDFKQFLSALDEYKTRSQLSIGRKLLKMILLAKRFNDQWAIV